MAVWVTAGNEVEPFPQPHVEGNKRWELVRRGGIMLTPAPGEEIGKTMEPVVMIFN